VGPPLNKDLSRCDAVFSDGYQGLLFDAGGEANPNGNSAGLCCLSILLAAVRSAEMFKASAALVQFIVRTGAVGPVPDKYGDRGDG
jgi:hypothetical protein